MAEGMPHGELVRRALEWILGQRAEGSLKTVSLYKLLDEAGMRFNLTPKDAGALERLLDSEQ
ncbi:MAG: hypothetical protein LBM64_00325 [Deltaproteobacteria bacterium]|jgi:hypothetical protein|nr:hypothetical protein [Deltaproteobacteria bacterium]